MESWLRKFNYIKIFISIVYLISIFIVGYNFGYTCGEVIINSDSKFGYIIFLLGLYLIYFVSYLISALSHELGHLVFGLKAKLKFVSFNIFNFVLINKDNKLSLKKQKKIPGVLGYCNMSFDENKKYNKKEISLYFMGGCIFNFLLVVMFLVLLFITNNKIINNIFMINIIINLYSALINLVPASTKVGLITDMLHLINCYKDSEYIKHFGKFFKVQNLLAEGYELKDMDENLFYKPISITSNSDVKMATLYIDYISEKERYDEAIEYIKILLKSENKVLLKSDINLLKVQLLNCLFYGEYDLSLVLNYWDSEVQKFLNLMSKIHPIFLGLNYMFAQLVEKDKNKSKKCLIEFEKIKKKCSDEKLIKETLKIINDVNSKLNP